MFSPSNETLVGVIAVETSDIETESFRIINCTGETGGEISIFEFVGRLCGGDLNAAFEGRAGASAIGAETVSLGSFVAIEGFLRGISSNFHSGDSGLW